MGRRSTCGIKGRKRTTVYLTDNIADELEQAHIDLQHNLCRHVGKTLFMDALFKTGLKHCNEVQSLCKVNL